MAARTVEIRVVNPDGSFGDYLPDYQMLEWGEEYSVAGSVTLTYPSTGRHADQLGHKNEFVVLVDGAEPWNARFRMEERSLGLVQDGKTTLISWAGPTLVNQLKTGQLYPKGWDDAEPKTVAETFAFANATPGHILNSALVTARNRNAVPWAEVGWTTKRDSAGEAWKNDDIDVEFDGGTTVLGVADWLVEKGYAEYRMMGRTVHLYNRGYGKDHTLEPGGPVIVAGVDMTDGQWQDSSADLYTRVFVKGDGKTYRIVIDGKAEKEWGQVYEGFTNAEGTKKQETMQQIGEYFLERYTVARYSSSFGVNLSDDRPDPFRAYNVGDWLWVQVTFPDETEQRVHRMRLVQRAVSASEGRAVGAAVTLNTKFEQRDVRLARILEKWGAGTT